jgi:alpha-L-fucosidase
VRWEPDGRAAEIDLGRRVSVSLARLEEDITRGQVVSAHSLLGSDGGPWQVLARGTTVGYARLHGFASTPVQRVRVVIDEEIFSGARLTIRLFSQ